MTRLPLPLIARVEVPPPQPGQVLVRVRAAALNFPDVLLTQGKYQFKPDLPFSPGGEVAGVERVPFEVHEEGLIHSVKIGDAIEFEIEDIVPFGVETGQPIKFDGMFHPVGSNLTMAEAKSSQISAFGIEYEGKTGLSSAFSWAA